MVIVQLGSSMTMFGLDARRVEDRLAADLSRPVVVHNLGVPGLGPVGARLYFERMLAEGIRPDLLILDVVPNLVCPHPADGGVVERQWFSPHRLRRHELSFMIRHGFPADSAFEWWKGSLVPFHTHRMSLVSAIAPKFLRFQDQVDWGRAADTNGFIPNRFPAQTKQHREDWVRKELGPNATLLSSLNVDSLAGTAIREIAAVAKREGILFQAVLMPSTSEIREVYDRQRMADLRGFLEELCGDVGVRLIDALDWVPDEDFLDVHHMGPSGAVVYSDRLVEPVRQLAARIVDQSRLASAAPSSTR